MVSRRTSLALVLAALAIGWLARALLRIDRPTRARAAPGPAALEERGASERALLEAPIPGAVEVPASERRSALADFSPSVAETPMTTAPALQEGMASVLVEVLDARGRPAAGVPVGSWFDWIDPDDPEPSTEAQRARTAREGAIGAGKGLTDASGLAEVLYRMPPAVELSRLRMHIAPLLALDELPQFETQPGELPPPHLVLRLPASGSVRVRVEPAELAAAAQATVEAVVGARVRRSAPVEDGEAFFTFIELGHELELRLATPTMAHRGSRIVVRGPESLDEVVEVALPIRCWPTLRFRLCDETGQALPNTSFAVRILHGKLSTQYGNAKTDENGATEFVVYGDARNDDGRELALWSTSPARLVQVWLPELLETPTELGTLVLRTTAPVNVPPR